MLLEELAKPPVPLDQQQERALSLIAEGLPDVRVAQVIQVDRRTIYRWRRMPAFRRQLELLRKDLREAARDRLHQLLPAAFGLIERQFENPQRPEALRAATLVLRSVMGQTLPDEDKASRLREMTVAQALGLLDEQEGKRGVG
jgi:hypothetical protein